MKRKYSILLIISILFLFISIMGMLGSTLDEKYMVYSCISDYEEGGIEHQQIKLRSYLFLLLGLLSFLSIGYSVFKIIK